MLCYICNICMHICICHSKLTKQPTNRPTNQPASPTSNQYPLSRLSLPFFSLLFFSPYLSYSLFSLSPNRATGLNYLPVGLPACLYNCLAVCLSACLSACLPACLSACFPHCLLVRPFIINYFIINISSNSSTRLSKSAFSIPLHFCSPFALFPPDTPFPRYH